jgi:hypothetical protein
LLIAVFLKAFVVRLEINYYIYGYHFMCARLTAVAKSFENQSIFAFAVIFHVAFAVLF